MQAAHDERVQQLEDTIAEAHKDLAEQQRTLKQVREKADAREAKLRSSLAETAAALNNATSSADGQAVKGTLKTTWMLGPKDKPWPTGCADPLKSYEVRVTAGQGALEPVWDDLHRLHLPYLALAGDRDERYAAAAGRLAQLAPQGRFTLVEAAGHAPQLQRPEAVARLLVEFLER